MFGADLIDIALAVGICAMFPDPLARLRAWVLGKLFPPKAG